MRMKGTTTALALLLGATALPAAAQQPAPPAGASQAQRIRSLESQVEMLRQELEAMKRAQAADRQVANDAKASADDARQNIVDKPLVTRSDDPYNKKVTLTLQGSVNRALTVASDGHSTKLYNTDNDVSGSSLRVEARGQISDTLHAGANVELGIGPNNSEEVSQQDEEPDTFFDEKFVEAFVQDDRYGRVTLGKGSAAADGTAEYDLSLTAGTILYASVADPVGGLIFRDGDTFTDNLVQDAFTDRDGDRQNRVRVDSATFLEGLQVAASAGSNQRWDAALTWGSDYGDWPGVEVGPFTTLGAISIRDPNDDGTDYDVTGSFSLIHNPTGIGATVSAGNRFRRGADPYDVYGKLFYDTSFVSWGKTEFAVDTYYGGAQTGDEDDRSLSIGGAVDQQVTDYGIDLYGQLRWFTFNPGDGPNPDDIVAATVGTKVKF